MRYLRTGAPLGLALCLAGCVLPIPPGGQHISQKELEAIITVGSTTKADVLERLHERQAHVVLQEGRFVIVEGGRSSGGLLLIGAGGYSAGAVGGSFGETNYRILFEFADNDILQNYQYEESRGASSWGTEPGMNRETWGPEGRAGVPQAAAPRRTLVESRDVYSSVAFSPDGKFVAAGDQSNRVLLWNLETGAEPLVFKGKAKAGTWGRLYFVLAVAFSPDGRTLAAGIDIDTAVRLWDVATGRELVSYEGHRRPAAITGFHPKGNVTALAFSPDGRRVATGDGFGVVKVWEAATGQDVATLNAEKNSGFWGQYSPAVLSLAYSPDGKVLATADASGWVRLREWETGRELASRRADACPSAEYAACRHIRVAFSPAGRLLVIAQAGFVELRRITPGGGEDSPEDKGVATPSKRLGELERPLLLPKIAPPPYGGSRDRLGFSADGRRLVWSNVGAAVWDVATGRELWRFIPPPLDPRRWSLGNLPDEKKIYDVALSPDGTVLATAGPRGVYLWDVPGREAMPAAAK